MNRTCAWSLSVVLVLPALHAAPSSTADTVPEFDVGNFVPAPLEQLGNKLGRAWSADWNGDLQLDVAQLQGTNLLVFLDPAVHSRSVLLSTGVRDACVVPDAQEAAHSALLLLGEAGLQRATFDVHSGAFQLEPLGTSKVWSSATRLAGPVAMASGAMGLLVLAEDQRTLMVAEILESGAIAEPKPIFACASPVSDLLPLDWDASSATGDECALLSAQGVQVVSISKGAAVFARSAVQSGGAIEVVEQAGLSDALAWLTRGADQVQRLLLLHAPLNGAGAQWAQPLDGLEVSDLAAGDWDGDGDEDLALLAAQAPRVFLSLNLASKGSWFDTSKGFAAPAFATSPADMPSLELWSGTYEGIENSASLVFAPLYNERLAQGAPRLDFALGLPSPAGLRVVPSDFASAAHASLPNPPAGASIQALFYEDADGASGECGDSLFGPARFWLRLGDAWQNHAEANAVEVVLWVRDPYASELDPVAWTHVVCLLPASGDETGFEADLALGSDLPSLFPEAFFFQVRLCTYDSVTQSVTAAWRSELLGLGLVQESQVWHALQPGAVLQPCPLNPSGDAPAGVALQNCAIGPYAPAALFGGPQVSQTVKHQRLPPTSGVPQAGPIVQPVN